MPPFISVPDLLARIPLTARSVLYVGCGNGELAAAYRAMNPKARLLGIEPDPVAAAAAAGHLDQVANVDIAVDTLPFDLPDGIDCIVYGAIHELADPWTFVRRHAEQLSPDGIVLLVLPNIEYWRRTERFLRGLADETGRQHPWLTQAGMTEQFARIGLSVCDITAVEPDLEAAQWFSNALSPGLSALGIDTKDFARRCAASHWVYRAAKDSIQRIIVAGNMLKPVGGVSHVRVMHPFQALETATAVTAAVVSSLEIKPPDDGIPRIFVMHRPSLVGPAGLSTLQKLSDAGYLAITEFDDHPDHFPMMKVGGDISFLGVHAVQTSTVAMAEALRKYNPEIAIFPNAIASLPEIRNFADPASLTFFFGALNREADWQPLMPIINNIANMAGSRLKFQVVHDQGFFDALETNQKTFTPICDYETYSRILGGCEISFMPLGDTPFNRAKSDLKFIEAGASRAAALASTVVYGDSIDDGRTGLLFRDPMEFHSRLLRLIAMPELARSLADAARQYVAEERMLAYQVATRIGWYRSLWNRRDELEQARLLRLQRRLAA
ncbi:MAG TPA: SAM-dependent methyltransferase [Acetobacteraceae bacterium]|jgi:hypothetical protein|nr:SAM-dependent methyltransferase [Acetobacteraceae bacterium]